MGLLLCLISSIFILIGSLIIIISKNNKFVVSFSLALAFIVILGLIFLELFEEAISNTNLFITILFVLLGIIVLKILDHFIPHHHELDNLTHIGIVTSIALIIHNLIEGMSIYAIGQTNLYVGILMSIGVGLHNIPVGMMVTSIILKTNKNKPLLFLLILSTLIGGLIMMLLNPLVNDLIIGIFLSITIGMLLFIAFDELLFKVMASRKEKATILGLISGLIIIVITVLLDWLSNECLCII